ncbi:MAG: hypothetical protein R3Y08_07480 [Rikenellaceae bacterium]
MKKFIFTLALILSSVVTLWAQEPTSEQDTIATFKVDNGDDVVLSSKNDGISINIAGYDILLGQDENAKYDQHQVLAGCGGIEIQKVELEEDKFTAKSSKKSKLNFASNSKLGLISLSRPDYSVYGDDHKNFLDLKPSKSIYYGLDLVGLRLPIDNKERLILKTGINLMCYNFTFANDITLTYQDEIITPVEIDNCTKKSKLTTAYAAIPLSLRVKLSKKLSIEPGVYAGLIVNSHTKYKKPKVKSDYLRGVNQAIAGASLSLYYNGIGLYCDYNFTTLFDQGRGPETRALSAGITFKL